MNQEAPARGRPRIGDPDAISEIALQLMTRDGWTSTTMQGIARATGVSTPTLFRYFPSKAAVLWHGMDENAERFRTEFAGRLGQVVVVDAILDSYIAMLHSDQSRLRLIRTRLTIMEHEDEAAAASWSKFDEWRQLVTSFVAQSSGESGDSLMVRVAGAVIWSGLSAALSAWALTDAADPAPFISAARSCIVVPEALSGMASQQGREN